MTAWASRSAATEQGDNQHHGEDQRVIHNSFRQHGRQGQRQRHEGQTSPAPYSVFRKEALQGTSMAFAARQHQPCHGTVGEPTLTPTGETGRVSPARRRWADTIATGLLSLLTAACLALSVLTLLALMLRIGATP